MEPLSGQENFAIPAPKETKTRRASAADERDRTKFWIAQDLNGIQLIRAVFTNHTFPRHSHDTFVIGVHEIGTEVFDCRGASHFSPTGSIITINPGEVHNGHSLNKGRWVYRGMYPNPTLLQDVATEFSGRTQGVPSFTSSVVYDERLAKTILDLHRVLETTQDTLERHTKLLVTFADLIEQHTDSSCSPKPVGSERSAVKRARQYIEAFHRKNITLQELARMAELNPFYLVRVFRKELGLPPHEFLTQVRVERAKRLLAGGWPVAQVALETGFVDQSHLTNRFKRIVGITPKQFAQGQLHTRSVSRNLVT